MNRFLMSAERAVSPPEAAQELIDRTSHPWGFAAFALGWMKLDVMARMLLVIILGVSPVLLTYNLDQHLEQSQSQLAAHSRLLTSVNRDPAAYASEQKVAEIGREYAQIAQIAQTYRDESESMRRIGIVGLAILGVLAVLIAIGQYRRYVATKHLKVALDFFRTDDGIAWLQENRDKPGMHGPDSPF